MPCLPLSRANKSPKLTIPSVETLRRISAGFFVHVYAIDDNKVLKKYDDNNDPDMFVELRVYSRLGQHPNIARFFGVVDGSIIIERGELLREMYKYASPNQIPYRVKYQWIKGAANGIQHLHQNRVIQADVGIHNMIVMKNNDLKLIDFGGASIDGERASTIYQWFSYKPSVPSISIQTDIFAFGCAVYEIISGNPPYHGLFENSENPRKCVEALYEQDQFPDVAHMPMASLILGCWKGEFKSMDEVNIAIERGKPSEVIRGYTIVASKIFRMVLKFRAAREERKLISWIFEHRDKVQNKPIRST